MQNTIVYLIRHSTPEHRLNAGRPAMYGPEAPLTAEGRIKVEKLRASLLAREGRPFDVIYSSPFKRAFETASILAEQALQKEVMIIPGLRDTVSDWPGTPMDELARIADAGRLFEDPRTHETIADIAARMTAAFQQVAASARPGQLVGVVSHGDPLRILYDRLRRPGEAIPPYPQLVREFSMGQAQGLRLEIDGAGRIEIAPDLV